MRTALAVICISTCVTLCAAQEPYTLTVPKSVAKIEMVPVPGGSLGIGGQSVEIEPFFMAATETTWEAFDAFLLSGPPSRPYDQTDFAPDAVARPSKSYIMPDLGWGHRGFPAINLSAINVEMFCRWLSAETGKKYRLPTEAEWEWASREAQSGDWTLDKALVEKQSWLKGNADAKTHAVGSKLANRLGIFDIFGNAGEWATDLKGQAVLCGPTFQDTLESVSPSVRRYYDSSWQETDPQIPQSRWWYSDGPFCGFRIVCEP